MGAMIVASIETVWSGLIEAHGKTILHTSYSDTSVSLEKGDEMGRFLLGSTVVMLYGEGAVEFESSLDAGSQVRMGQKFGTLKL